jgi:hypothetical protein
MMHEPEKSDSSIVATKPANKSEQSGLAVTVLGLGLPKHHALS